jgi:orotate phosphoribosyltransferase
LCKAINNAGIDFDYIVGVPYGAILLADVRDLKYFPFLIHASKKAVAELLGKPMTMMRKEAKSHGKKEMLLGDYKTGKRIVIIEDVVTYGTSIMETVAELNKVPIFLIPQNMLFKINIIYH